MPMNIAMIAPLNYLEDRGANIRVYEMSRLLLANGHKITLFCFPLGKDVKADNLKIIRSFSGGLKQSPKPGFSFKKIYLDFFLFFSALLKIKKNEFDMIYAFMHEGLWIGHLIKSLKGLNSTRLVFDNQDSSLAEEMVASAKINEKGMLYDLIEGLEMFFVPKSDLIITTSEAIANRMKEIYPCLNHKIFAFPDGVSEFPINKENAENLIRKFNLEGKKVIYFLGLLTEIQGINHIPKIIEYILSKEKDTVFVISGYPIEKSFTDKIKTHIENGKVILTGGISYFQLYDYLSLADVEKKKKKVMKEGNSKLLNYMAIGLPAVVFDYPANREILGECGIYAKKEDSLDMAKKIIELLHDKKKCNKILLNSQKRFKEISNFKKRTEWLSSILKQHLF
ncbi:glycosyltransferase [Candidatus Pacearchaeota archaeon]|nr:glycosyltransferase [Candidatus Pacearchaeota archaeon]